MIERMFDARVSPGVGIDVVEPARLQQRMQRNPQLELELFTAAERRYCRAQPNSIQHFAARFCAKEAVVKALAIDGFEPLEIEILDPAPAPSVLLHGEVAARARALGVHVSVSLTHVESLAIAVVVAERRKWLRRALACARLR